VPVDCGVRRAIRIAAGVLIAHMLASGTVISRKKPAWIFLAVRLKFSEGETEFRQMR